MSKLDKILDWIPVTKDVASLLTREDFLLGKYQDNAFHPTLDVTAKSKTLNTPIGDRFLMLSHIENNVTIEFLIEDPIITISRPREIIQTSINGLDGKIIEIVSNGNYEINIVGVLSGPSFWNYDEISIKLLELTSKYKNYLDLNSPYLNNCFDIHKIVITDHKIAQSTEFSNITAIEINCVSVLNENIFFS